MSRSTSHSLTLVELADLLGRYRYVELGLFGLVGQRAASVVAPPVCIFLSGASHSHAYRVGLIEGRLPVSIGLPDVVSGTRTPSAEIDALLAKIATAPDDELLGIVVAGWYPAMLASYLEHLKSTSSPNDAPIIRMLQRIISDLEERISEGVTLAGVLGQSLEAIDLSKALTACKGPFGTLIP